MKFVTQLVDLMDNITVPPVIDKKEEVVRILLSPMHYNNKNNSVLPYTFKPPHGLEDISVNRKEYTTPFKCEQQGRNMQNSSNIFWGVAIVSVDTIREIGFDVIASPIKEDLSTGVEENLAHADIKIGFKPITGEPLPTDITRKIKTLISKLKIIEAPLPVCW